MVRTLMLSAWIALFALAGCQEAKRSGVDSASSAPRQTAAKQVEAGCGSCIFGMQGVAGCPLAVKVHGKAYLVSGVQVDAHGAGLCSSSKKAMVTGQIQGDEFMATSFTLEDE